MHLIMFDIDGTLVDSAGFDGELFAQAVEAELGIEVDRSWHSYRHVTDSGILGELLATCTAAAERQAIYDRVKRRFVALVETYVAGQPAGLVPIPGAPTFVAMLRATPGVIVALATGGWRETAELKLAAAGIDFAGLPFASATDAPARADIMRVAEQRATPFGPFRRRSYFGDGPWDAAASAELGYDFVGVGNRTEHPVRIADYAEPGAVMALLAIQRVT